MFPAGGLLVPSRNSQQRHNARPYGFQFSTRERNDGDLDSHETKRSGTFFLGGTMLTIDDLDDRNDADDDMLRSNMKNNNWDRVIENTNSWKITLPFRDADTLLAG